MQKQKTEPRNPSADPVYLTASAISSLITGLPSGTAYCIGIFLVVLMTGRLVQHKGSLARAVLPFVSHLKWGWHRVERALERGKLSLDSLIDRAYEWCLQNLEVETVRLGEMEREVMALDTTTIARLRSKEGKSALLGKGYCHRAGRAVRANIVCALVSVVLIRGVRVGLLRGLRFAKSSESAVEAAFKEIAKMEGNYLIVVDAGIATKDQFAAASEEKAVLGRLRINCKLRCAPRPPNGLPGRDPIHGAVLHPGRAEPEKEACEELWVAGDKGEIRVRRWRELHYEGREKIKLDVIRIDDPAYQRPLIVGTTACELKIEEMYLAYPHRWPVETLFYVGEETTATEKPRAWSERAVERRIGMGLMSGSLLKAIAASGEALAMGPWDRKACPTAGRLANHLDIQGSQLLALALKGVESRNYRKNPKAAQAKDLQSKKVA